MIFQLRRFCEIGIDALRGIRECLHGVAARSVGLDRLPLAAIIASDALGIMFRLHGNITVGLDEGRSVKRHVRYDCLHDKGGNGISRLVPVIGVEHLDQAGCRAVEFGPIDCN
ncbi:hypothetical protein D3C81_963110 [compost metagenome]